MKYFKLKYEDGKEEVKRAHNSLELIKEYDLATAKNVNTRIIELQGEMLAIAIANEIKV